MKHFSVFVFLFVFYFTFSNSVYVNVLNNNSCNECIDEISKLMYYLQDNATLSKLEDTLDLACTLLIPVNKYRECKDDVKSLINGLEKTDKNWIEDYSPKQFCSILSICQDECCSTPYWPEQIHISLSDDHSKMWIMWTTSLLSTSPTVKYGKSFNNLNMTITDSSMTETYTKGGWNGHIYRIQLQNLEPATSYYYTVGDPNWVFSRNIYNFTTAPDTVDTTVRFGIYGDMGASDASDNTLEWVLHDINNKEIDAMLHVGDISYADGYQPLWDQFLRKVEPIAARVPYMTVPGNHEDFFDFTAYRYRFQMPVSNLVNVTRSTIKMYYSFDYGPAHIIGISMEEYWGRAPNLDPGNPEYEWLQNDLEQAQANRKNVPFVIIHAHHPLYCTETSSKWCFRQASFYQDKIEDLINQYNVDLFIQAHVHNYERTYPVYKDQVVQQNYTNPQAPVYSVVGTGGCKEGLFGSFQKDPPNWSVPDSRMAIFGYVIMEITPTTLDWKFFDSQSHQIKDQFQIIKN